MTRKSSLEENEHFGVHSSDSWEPMHSLRVPSNLKGDWHCLPEDSWDAIHNQFNDALKIPWSTDEEDSDSYKSESIDFPVDSLDD